MKSKLLRSKKINKHLYAAVKEIQGLDPGKVYIINVEVGDMAKQTLDLFTRAVVNAFQQYDVKVIISPTRGNVGKLQVEGIKDKA